MREPLPKELVREAWKARVGWSRERDFTHDAYPRKTQLAPRIGIAIANCRTSED